MLVLVAQPVATQSVSPQPAVIQYVGPRPAAALPEASQPPVPQPGDPVAPGSPAEGQGQAEYLAWLAGSPEIRAGVLAFNQFLEMEGVAGVLPTWQLLRTASMWDECDGPRFEVAPPAEWQHIAEALKFIRAHVIPVVGPVEAVSGYRNAGLNHCARGAPESAHRHFYALDLVPVRPISRAGLVRNMCAAHQRQGEGYDIGLGFYAGTRFHIDSKGFRRWGADGSGASSPCMVEV